MKTQFFPLQLVKNYIGVCKIGVEELLIQPRKNARIHYTTFLDEKKKIEMEKQKELEKRQ